MISEFIVPPRVPNYPKVNQVLGDGWLKCKVEDAMAPTKGKVILHPSRMSPTFGWEGTSTGLFHVRAGLYVRIS